MSFYDDAKTISLMSGAAGKDGKIYNVKPDGSLGSELIINGSFDTNSDWTTGSGFSISNGVVSCDGTQTAATNLHNTSGNGLVNGKTYRVEYTITSYTAGSVRVKAGNTGYGVYRSAAGTYVEHLVAGVSTFPTVQFNADADFVGSIDNVSCKEMDVADFNFYRGTNLTATRVGPDGLIEKGRENLLLQSNQFDTTWTDPNAEVTSGYAGRDGSNDAWEPSLTGTFGQTAQAVSASGVNTLSFYAKSGTSDFTRPYIAGPNKYAYFDLLNGQTGSQTGVASSIEDAGNGWWRCSFTVEGNITEVRLHVADSINTIGTNTSGTIYIQDAQLEQGLVATDYIETGATTAKAGLLEDEPRFDYTGGGCPKLLLEPLRANELPYSEYFTDQTYWQLNSAGTRTNNSAKSPEGVLNATSFESVGSEYNILRSAPLTLDTSTKYVFSFYAKNVDATNAHYRVYNTDSSSEVVAATSYFSQLSTTEWKRIEVSFTTDSTDTNYSVYFASGNLGGEILLWGAQVEKGSFATSYIPTHGQAATRTLDGKNSSSDIMIPADAFDLTGDFAIMMDLGDINYTHGTAASSFPLLFLITGSSNKNFGIYFNPGTSSDGDEGINVYFQNNGNYVFGSGSNDAAAGDSKVLVTYNSTTDKLAYYINGELFDSETRALSYDASTRGYFQALSATGDGDECSFEINKIIFFDNDLSVNDSQILTGTSYTNFAEMASELSYTEYE